MLDHVRVQAGVSPESCSRQRRGHVPVLLQQGGIGHAGGRRKRKSRTGAVLAATAVDEQCPNGCNGCVSSGTYCNQSPQPRLQRCGSHGTAATATQTKKEKYETIRKKKSRKIASSSCRAENRQSRLPTRERAFSPRNSSEKETKRWASSLSIVSAIFHRQGGCSTP